MFPFLFWQHAPDEGSQWRPRALSVREDGLRVDRAPAEVAAEEPQRFEIAHEIMRHNKSGRADGVLWGSWKGVCVCDWGAGVG